jgi:hypothetical protein
MRCRNLLDITLRYHLKLPTTLKPEDQQVYKQLLTLMPSNFIYNSDSMQVSSPCLSVKLTNIFRLVPNGNRLLVKANTLYTRHALFVAAFGSDSSPTHFILDIFRFG